MLRLMHITESSTKEIARAEHIALLGGNEKSGLLFTNRHGHGFNVMEFERDDIPDLIHALQLAYDLPTSEPTAKGEA